jgi:hypothetical protein
MSTLNDELKRVLSELGVALSEHARLGARIEGLRAEQAALERAIAASRITEATDEPVELASMTKDRAIVAVLAAAGRPLKIGEIVDALQQAGRTGENYNGISVYLDTLLKQGRVERPERGLYAPVGK